MERATNVRTIGFLMILVGVALQVARSDGDTLVEAIVAGLIVVGFLAALFGEGFRRTARSRSAG